MSNPLPKLFLLLVAALPLAANERQQGDCMQGSYPAVTSGINSITKLMRSFPRCTVSVYLTGTATLATVYSDNSSTPLANPFTADRYGHWFFYAANGRYDVTLSGAGFPAPFTLGDLLLSDSGTGFNTTGLLITPTPGTTNVGIGIIQIGPASGNQNAAIDFNYINILSDQANSGAVPNYVRAFDINYSFGGANMSGPRTGIQSNLTLTAPASPTSSNNDYVPVQGVCTMNSSDNGTNTAGGANGACYGANFVSQALAGATNLFEVGGAEFNVSIHTGASARVRVGVNPVAGGDIQASGDTDAAFMIGASGSSAAAAWKNGIYLTNLNGRAPIYTNGCVICTAPFSSTITTGIDLSAFNITGNFLAGPSGFTITGAGSANIPHITSSGTAPTCSSTGLGSGSCAPQAFSTDFVGALALSPTGSPSNTGTATLTFASALGTHYAKCSLGYENGSGGWNVPVQILITSSSATAVSFVWGQTGNLTAGVSYLLTYHCIGI